MQRQAHDRGIRLIAGVVEPIIGRKGGGIAHLGRSLISTIALLQTARRLAVVEVDLERCDSKTEVAEA